METVLSWIAVGIGAAGAALGAMTARLREMQERTERGHWFVAGFALAATVVLFLATLPVEPPVFSPGQRMGYGILIGGLLGVIAGIWPSRLRGATAWASWVAAAGQASLALLGAGLVLLVFRGYPQPAIGGFIIGAVVVSAIFRLTLPLSAGLDIWSLSAVAVGATTLLATFRFDTVPARVWWAAPLLVLAAAIVTTIASAALARRNNGFLWPALAASVVTLGLIAVFAWKVFPEWALLWSAIAGVASFAVIAWLGSLPSSAQRASATVLVVLALSAVGFKLMAGFGIGIGMLAGWAILLPAVASTRGRELEESGQPSPVRAVTHAMFIGVGILLLRLFMESYASELRGMDLRPHYTFVALALGVIFPFVLTSLFPTSSRRGIVWATVGAAALGLLAAASPLLILFIWGFKAALGFMVGMVAAKVFIMFIDSGAVSAGESSYSRSSILVTAAQVSAVQLSGLVGPLTQETPRATKVIALGAFVVVGIIWAVISALIAGRGSREE